MIEAMVKGRATLIEKTEKGHSLLRHEPDLADDSLFHKTFLVSSKTSC
jgi:hypothetical protein